MITVVLDTNIIISGLLFGGKPKEILQLITKGKLKGFISPYILFEVKDVLIKKFNWNLEMTNLLEDLLKKDFVVIHPKKTINFIKRVKADNRILECAVESEADFLISGDKRDILKIKRIRKTKIVTPEELLMIVKSSPTTRQ